MRFSKNRDALNCPLYFFVYAQHGRELMGCKSSVGEPTSFIIYEWMIDYND